MSHIEEATTKLQFQALATLLCQQDTEALDQHPCLVLLRQAVALVAFAHDGSVTTTYDNYAGQAQPTNLNLALHVPDTLPRGIGLVVNTETGALLFQGDPWDYRAFFEEVQRTIVQQYVVLAHGAALRRMRAQVSTKQVEGQVVVTGVFHG